MSLSISSLATKSMSGVSDWSRSGGLHRGDKGREGGDGCECGDGKRNGGCSEDERMGVGYWVKVYVEDEPEFVLTASGKFLALPSLLHSLHCSTVTQILFRGGFCVRFGLEVGFETSAPPYYTTTHPNRTISSMRRPRRLGCSDAVGGTSCREGCADVVWAGGGCECWLDAGTWFSRVWPRCLVSTHASAASHSPLPVSSHLDESRLGARLWDTHTGLTVPYRSVYTSSLHPREGRKAVLLRRSREGTRVSQADGPRSSHYFIGPQGDDCGRRSSLPAAAVHGRSGSTSPGDEREWTGADTEATGTAAAGAGGQRIHTARVGWWKDAEWWVHARAEDSVSREPSVSLPPPPFPAASTSVWRGGGGRDNGVAWSVDLKASTRHMAIGVGHGGVGR
ncbi:hypothetical protein R3P38DRAFT_2771614 [Favolaschia claudopus]|uniref:Uncharacterized protein n=1 Tax=Favolaschia claudopus TaxID=2862362 RepID=A0AAW0C8U0_9AGAR